MATTLSITLDDEAVAAAQQIAIRQGTDVESMIGKLLRRVANAEKPFDPSTLPPITRSALGMARGKSEKSDKELLVEILTAKYESLK